MRRKILILFLFFVTSDFVFGKNQNETKSVKINHHKINNERKKRSIDERSLPYFLPIKEELIGKLEKYAGDADENGRKAKFEFNNETPFWGTRGRRESGSDERITEVPLPSYIYNVLGKGKNLNKLPVYFYKQMIDEIEPPFWGNRGRRTSEESDKNDIGFWGNRGRRQDDEPFWGTRGRRQEDSPFWVNKGRRENMFIKHATEDDEPFWGNRGRRESFEPFWGSRGKKKLHSLKTFKEESELFWGNRNSRRKLDLKESLAKAINDVENNVKNLAIRKENLKPLLNGSNSVHLQSAPYALNENSNDEFSSNTFEQNTVNDDRIFAEEPHYILVERSSRSSEEDDPFFISRGKKFKYINLAKTSRGRRGALEEIVKSVRNDPYYVARGKKDGVKSKLNPSLPHKKLLKAKELICATVELLATNYEKNMIKKHANDNERDRRTILKKLALQLQMDPYFVSRGKKIFDSTDDLNALEKFLNQISVLCT